MLLSWLARPCDGWMAQRPLLVRFPRKTISLLYVILASCLLKVAIHPTSHSLPIDSKELRRSGKRCACMECFGRVLLIGKCVVAVEVIVVWSGSWTVIGVWGIFWLLLSLVCLRKCPVAPVSMMRGVEARGIVVAE